MTFTGPFKKIIKKRWEFQDYLWLAFNLAPIVLYLWGTFTAYQAFTIYVAETIIIGAIVVLKILGSSLLGQRGITGMEGGKARLAALMLIPFFIAHYGAFVCIQFTLFMHVSGLGKSINPITNFRLAWFTLGPTGQSLIYLNSGILLLYGAADFFARREFDLRKLPYLMFEPYQRIFVQQFTVIIGSMLLNFGAGTAFLAAFMVAKIFFSCFVELKPALPASVQKQQ